MRGFFSRCHRAGAFPEEPGHTFPNDVLHPGAFPLTPYELGFWGFPCTPWAGLKRNITWEEIERALATFEAALSLLGENPPKARECAAAIPRRSSIPDVRHPPLKVFILENTASLVGLPRALGRVTDALEALPYTWRRETPPQLLAPSGVAPG